MRGIEEKEKEMEKGQTVGKSNDIISLDFICVSNYSS